MDLSLDDYITKNPGFNKNRLGTKISPGKANLKVRLQNERQNQTGVRMRITAPGQNSVNTSTQGIVTSRGRGTQFDARQKLSGIQNQPGVQDARQKLSGANRLKDARIRIQNKTNVQITAPNQAGGVTVKAPGATSKAAALGANDMRIKIQHNKAKKTDARQLIRARQQGKTPGPVQTVNMVSQKDVGQAGGMGITNRGGSLQKTIKAGDQESLSRPLSKTIQNLDAFPVVSNRIGNNIVITPGSQASRQSQNYQFTVPPPPQTYTQPAYNPQQYSQPVPVQQVQANYSQPVAQYQPPYHQQPMPTIRIQNDAYRPPEPAAYVATSPPTYQYYSEPAGAGHFPAETGSTYSAQSRMSHHTEPATDTRYSWPSEPNRTEPTAESSWQIESRRTQAGFSSKPVQVRPSLQARLSDETTQEIPPGSDLSPLQGYRVLITNLHPIVTQDDIVELFGAVGALKKARLVKVGTAEVVFVKKDEALAAIRKYNNRELDGQPMYVKMVTSGITSTQKPQAEVSQPLRLPKSGGAGEVTDVDVGLLHKALFKTTNKDELPTRPVTFTVKI